MPPLRLVLSLAGACLALILGWGMRPRVTSEEAYDHLRGRPLLGPSNFDYCTMVYERHPRLALHRLVIVAHRGQAAKDAEVKRSLEFTSTAISRHEPFTALYDMREISFPTLSRAQLGMGVAWARENTEALDQNLQCIAFLFISPLVRATAKIVLNFVRPPQPVYIGKDELGAFRFASEKCTGKQNWGSATRERDRKHGRRKWT